MNRPIKLRNLISGEQAVDNLHNKYRGNSKQHSCNELRCLGSLINPKPIENKVRNAEEIWLQAKDFIDNFYASIKRLESPAHKNRLAEIKEQLKTNETYYLKETELIYGAKLAWRNASRCIGRIQWSKLQVFDARFTKNADEMFEALCNHIKYATNKGSLRSAITIMPQRVKSVKNDWRIWNSQLIGYAGYKDKETGKIVGDPQNVDFTEICQKLGWQGKGTRFDILPIVLSANGCLPQLYPLPEDLVLRVKIKHPKYKWFEDLGLEWYALPAVANMMLDVGGLQFTAAPFSGWYMVTEIGTRDLGDPNRYNMLEVVAQKMGLNTISNSSLWRDYAINELNLAVLDSFQSAGVTIVDHHTASETFMTHFSNEQRLRAGCPADWVWLVPPTAGSSTQVFHQEMVNYHLLPNYEYMEPVWKHYDWSEWELMKQMKLDQKRDSVVNNMKSKQQNGSKTPLISSNLKVNVVEQITNGNGLTSLIASSNGVVGSNGDMTPRKLRFKEIARAVKFTSKLFGKALSRRIKATILYATETGKSERFANKLAQIFSCAFNVHLMSMSDYDMTCLEHEALLIIVTSTFGNGDPPENGELFAKHLAAIKLTGDTSPDIDSINSVSTNPFFQMLSEDHKDGNANSGLDHDSSDDSNDLIDKNGNLINCLDGLKRTQRADDKAKRKQNMDKQENQTNIRPLSNVRFAVFALGSTAYPHFCAFGRYVDQTLSELGAERILKCTCGDELCGQEKAFNEWSNQAFKIACDVFCLTDSLGPMDDRSELTWNPSDVRFAPVELINDNTIHTDGSTPTTTLQQTNSTIIKAEDILTNKTTIVNNLIGMTNKRIVPFSVKRRIDLHRFMPEENLQTLRIDLENDATPIESISEQHNSNPVSVNDKRSTSIDGSSSSNPTKTIAFEPGDHVGVFPVNSSEVVDKIINRMRENIQENIQDTKLSSFDFDQVYTILVKRENMDLTPAAHMPTATQDGDDCWIPHDRLPVTSIREALTRYLDITNPPNQEFLSILSRQTSDPDERKRLQQMARNFTIYEEWKNKRIPSLLTVLEEFKTIKFEPSLVTQIPLIKPRFYSISGTSITLTVGVVRFRTASGELREGLCSNYLNRIPIQPKIYLYGYIRSAQAFHMPQDKTIPMILISAGTGIAPFRSFWQQRYEDMYKAVIQNSPPSATGTLVPPRTKFGSIDLYFGCRNSNYILYKEELDEMHEAGVLSSINVGFSRPLDCDVFEDANDVGPRSNKNAPQRSSLPKSGIASIRQARRRVYVQDKLLEHSERVHKLITIERAHVYVCGDVAMADGVYKTLAAILSANKKAACRSDEFIKSSNTDGNTSNVGESNRISSDDGEVILMNLRNLNRYHEDIFGAKQMS